MRESCYFLMIKGKTLYKRYYLRIRTISGSHHLFRHWSSYRPYTNELFWKKHCFLHTLLLWNLAKEVLASHTSHPTQSSAYPRYPFAWTRKNRVQTRLGSRFLLSPADCPIESGITFLTKPHSPNTVIYNPCRTSLFPVILIWVKCSKP